MVDRGEVGVKWMKMVKRHKSPIIRNTSSGDVMFNMITTVNKSYIVYSKVTERVDLRRSHYKRKIL